MDKTAGYDSWKRDMGQNEALVLDYLDASILDVKIFVEMWQWWSIMLSEPLSFIKVKSHSSWLTPEHMVRLQRIIYPNVNSLNPAGGLRIFMDENHVRSVGFEAIMEKHSFGP